MNLDKVKQAREELHKLIQLVGMVPRSYLPHDPSDSSASLLWNPELKALVSQEANEIVLGLSIETQRLLVVKYKDMTTLPVVGKTYEEVKDELLNTLSNLGLDSGEFKTELPYKLPASVLDQGVPFTELDSESLHHLSELYHITHKTLVDIFSGRSEASKIRCWPHHFDIASLLTVEAHDDPEEVKSIGFGFSPGDAGYEEPYFYLTPWPYPETSQLYDLQEPAIWNTSGWTGAVLKANELSLETMEESLTSFFNTGLSKLKPLL